MIYVLAGMSLLFIAIGLIVTENNAQYLLSGYNTMSEEERKKVDITSYIPYFRKFHIFLGISLLIMGLALNYLISESAGGVFLGVYPILAYIYFIWTSSKYSKGLNTQWNKVGIFMLTGTLIFLIGLFGLGFKEDQLIIKSDKIEMEGFYGEILTPSDIESVALTDNLPEITMKTNGFALGTVSKGYFKTREGEVIKLMLNADHKPYILIIKKSGEKIYFSAKGDSNKKIYDNIKSTLPGIMYP